jgi:hypothetical protein
MSHVVLTSFTLDNMMKTKLIIVPCDNVTCSIDFLHTW